MVPLSRAIYEGACVTKQCKYALAKDKANTRVLLIGLQVLFEHEDGTYDILYKTWPILKTILKRPCEHGFHCFMHDVVIHLNDVHGWSREKIAEWVAKIEREQGENQK